MTQGTQEVSPTQVQAATPASMVPSTQPASTAAPSKWPPNKRVHIQIAPRFSPVKPFPQLSSFRRTEVLFGFPKAQHLWHLKESQLLKDFCYSQDLAT